LQPCDLGGGELPVTTDFAAYAGRFREVLHLAGGDAETGGDFWD